MSSEQREFTDARAQTIDHLPVIDGELLELSGDEEIAINQTDNLSIETKDQRPKTEDRKINSQSAIHNYLFLPFVFLTVALLGGLRVGAVANDFLFLKPPLVCLIFAAVLLVLFFRTNLIRLDSWFSENFSTLKTIANATVLLTLFAASAQVFNSLLPEKGLPFWVIGFCFFWTLWNNLFAEFDTKKLLKSLGAMFGLAFVVKYLLLANLTAPANESWWQGIFQNPAQEAFTFLLDLPRFSAATGYIQFFTLAFYLVGLFLLPSVLSKEDKQ